LLARPRRDPARLCRRHPFREDLVRAALWHELTWESSALHAARRTAIGGKLSSTREGGVIDRGLSGRSHGMRDGGMRRGAMTPMRPSQWVIRRGSRAVARI